MKQLPEHALPSGAPPSSFPRGQLVLLTKSVAEVQKALAQFPSHDKVWLALRPDVMHFLEARNLPYLIVEDLTDRHEIEQACQEQFSRLCQKLAQWDRELSQKDTFFQNNGYTPFMFAYHEVGAYLDYLTRCCLIIAKLAARYPEACLVVFQDPAPVDGRPDLAFWRRNALAAILAGLSSRLAVHILASPEYPREDAPSSTDSQSRLDRLRGLLSAKLRASLMANSAIFSLQERFYGNLPRLTLGRFSRHPRLWVLRGLYEWKPIVKNALANGAAVWMLPKLGPNLFYGAALPPYPWEKGCDFGKIRWAFRAASLEFDLGPHLNDVLQAIAAWAPSLCRHLHGYLSRRVGKRTPLALLFSTADTLPDFVVRRFCLNRGIRVLGWQHGAMWGPERITQRNDLHHLMCADTAVVYGRKVKALLEASPHFAPQRKRVLSLGMPSLSGLSSLAPHRSREQVKLLWVLGSYVGSEWYCGFSPPVSDGLYYRSQLAILRGLLAVAEEDPRLRVVIKLYQSARYSDLPPWLPDIAGQERFRTVLRTPTFTQLLDRCDGVIVDSPTTTLLQAAATRLPLFVCTANLSWGRRANGLLSRRALVAPDGEGIVAGVRQWLEGGRLDCDPEDQAFLEQYGLDPAWSGLSERQDILSEILSMRG